MQVGDFSGLSDYADRQVAFQEKGTQGSRSKSSTKILQISENMLSCDTRHLLGAFLKCIIEWFVILRQVQDED